MRCNKLFVVVVVIVSQLSCVLGASIVAKRSLESVNKEKCTGRTPCGWAVYNGTSRYIDYFMKNKCVCSAGKRCLRDSDDLSLSAYVYRCMVPDPNSRPNM